MIASLPPLSALFFPAFMLAQVEVPALALAWYLPKRRMPAFARPLVILALFAPAWAYLVTRWGSGVVNVWGYVSLFVLVLVLCMATIIALYRVPFLSALFCATAGYTIQNLATSINVLLQDVMIPSAGRALTQTASQLLSTAVLVVSYAALYLVFVRPVRRDRLELVEDRRMLIAFAACAVAVIWFDVLIKAITAEGAELALCGALRVVHISFCAFLLYFDYKSLVTSRLETETQVDRHIIAERGRQYEESRRAIDAMNQRMHDVCHAVANVATDLGSTGDPRVDALITQILDDVRHYDAVIKTGNDSLDTVITEKSLVCGQEGITLSPIADGSALAFLQPAETYTLIGGLIDAAVAEVRRYGGSEKDISLTVRRRQDMALVSLEHFAATGVEVRLERGTRLIVERYDGSISSRVESGIRTVSVVLPIPSA